MRTNIYKTGGAPSDLKHKSEYHNKWIIIRLQTSKLKKQKT